MNCIEMDTNMDNRDTEIESINLVLIAQNQLNDQIQKNLTSICKAIELLDIRLNLMQKRICNCYCHKNNNVKFWRTQGIDNHAVICCHCEV